MRKNQHTHLIFEKFFFIKRLNQSIAMPVTKVLTQCDLNVKEKKFNQARVNGGKRFGPMADQARQNRWGRLVSKLFDVPTLLLISFFFSKKKLRKSADDKKA